MLQNTKAYNQEIFNIYWMNNLQFRTANKQEVIDYIQKYLDYGHKKDEFTVSSNFTTSYHIQDLNNWTYTI